jgi:hypothetical protein
MSFIPLKQFLRNLRNAFLVKYLLSTISVLEGLRIIHTADFGRPKGLIYVVSIDIYLSKIGKSQFFPGH